MNPSSQSERPMVGRPPASSLALLAGYTLNPIRSQEGSAMPQIFTGKVRIPADQIAQYFSDLEAANQVRAPFRRYLEGLHEEFTGYLTAKYAQRTVTKHASIFEMFIEFLCDYTDVTAIEEITRGIVNTHFRQWYKRKVWSSATPDDLRVALKKFFQFLETEKGIANPKAVAALQ